MNQIYSGPPIDDPELLTVLPQGLASSLEVENGFVVADGCLHVRGACLNPEWHSMRAAWEGQLAIHLLYSNVSRSDIPIAEDCFGDQYLIRDGGVFHLSAETGELAEMHITWAKFVERAMQDPVGFLQLSHFVNFFESGGELLPGQLLSVYPPFVAKECVNPSLKPIPALELRAYLADFAKQIQNLADESKIRIVAK